MKRNLLPGLLLLLFPGSLLAQQFLEKFQSQEISPSIRYYYIQTDSLFNSTQDIHILKISTSGHAFDFDLDYRDMALVKTSTFASIRGAVAAINGGFFDVKHGGSVNYLEEKGKVIDFTRKEGEKGAISGQTMNGAVVFSTSGKLRIEQRRSDEYYAESNLEKFVLVTGPILMIDQKAWELPDTNFSNNRHPRSCLCINDQFVMMIAVDGRSETGSGMSLPELQQFLQWTGCKNAINLDGGGSTTLWIGNRESGEVLNHPSDKTGERSVANVILLISH